MVWLAVRRFQNRFDQKAEKRSSWARIDRLADHLRARLAVVGNTQPCRQPPPALAPALQTRAHRVRRPPHANELRRFSSLQTRAAALQTRVQPSEPVCGSAVHVDNFPQSWSRLTDALGDTGEEAEQERRSALVSRNR